VLAADVVHEAVHRDGDPVDGGVHGVPSPNQTSGGRSSGSAVKVLVQ